MWQVSELELFVSALQAGEVVAAPAEGVYGYCADPFNPAALARLLELKKRDANKGFILLVPDAAALARVCAPLDTASAQAVETYWQPEQPPTTLLLPPRPELPPFLRGTFPTIAVRMPHVAYVQNYLQAWGGPLVSTSLNVSGAAPAITAAEVPSGIVTLTLPEALSGRASRIFDPVTGRWIRH